jgi:hypothetical protein
MPMFHTIDSSEVILDVPGQPRSERQYWEQVEMFGISAVLLMELRDRGESIGRIRLVSRDLSAGINEAIRERLRIHSVRAITPGWINGTGDWRLERLSELWEVEDPRYGYSGWLLVSEGGNSYVDFSPHCSVSDLHRIRKVFPRSPAKRRLPPV